MAPILVENGVALVRARHGPMLVPATDTRVGRALLDEGAYCEDEVRLLQALLRPGATALDAGAHVGPHTLPMARAVGPAGRVFAFEPQPHLFRLLCGNLALNGLAQAEPVEAALGAAQGDVARPDVDYFRPGNFGAVALGTGPHRVPVLTVDGLDLADCRLIKIDVEGMEAAVLDGARATIARCRPALYVENNRRDRSPALIGRLLDLGYACWWHPARYGAAADSLWELNMVALPRAVAELVMGLRPVSGAEDWYPGAPG